MEYNTSEYRTSSYRPVIVAAGLMVAAAATDMARLPAKRLWFTGVEIGWNPAGAYYFLRLVYRDWNDDERRQYPSAETTKAELVKVITAELNKTGFDKPGFDFPAEPQPR